MIETVLWLARAVVDATDGATGTMANLPVWDGDRAAEAVQWCHGAPGLVPLLCLAAVVTGAFDVEWCDLGCATIRRRPILVIFLSTLVTPLLRRDWQLGCAREVSRALF